MSWNVKYTDEFENQQKIWHCRRRDVICGEHVLVMGILNVTPDSFSDGGRFVDPEKAVEHGLKMIAQGAEIIDIGGESTRPGATPVEPLEEIRRIIPVIEKLRTQTDALISVDTRKTSVAREALNAGADGINDVSALTDPGMAKLAAETGAGVVLMHMQGLPETMQDHPSYDDVVFSVQHVLKERMAFAISCGIAPEQIVIDPGIGFGKTDEHNLALLNGIPHLTALGRPVLIGVSRKSLFGRLLGRGSEKRLAGSLTAAVFSVLQGAHILRVHDVIESCDAIEFMDKLRIQGKRK